MAQNERDLLNRIRDGARNIRANQQAVKKTAEEGESEKDKTPKPIPLRTYEEIQEEVRLKNEQQKG